MHALQHRIIALALFISILNILAGQNVDHSEFIEGPFESVHTVTETCLMCHDYVADSFMEDAHWTWENKQQTIPGLAGFHSLGKKVVLNNFCIGVRGNEPRCTSCHAGYGWRDSTFDFTDPLNIDCLVCHDQTGTYEKFPTGAGYPVSEPKEFPPKSGRIYQPPDLEFIAQNVGLPTRKNCGSCHFYGGGGNNVKHGDLESALVNPSPNLDIHMGALDFSCIDCHQAEDHHITGSAMSLSTQKSTLSCENCHSSEPHEKYAYYLNKHAESIACQSCHIPEIARENPTKLYWDWSQAGEDRPVETDEFGQATYNKKKGSFEWGKNVIPTYAWYNGQNQHMLLGDKIDPDSVNAITQPVGGYDDPEAKIYPFKVHRGKQIADKKNRYLLPTHLYDGGYWDNFDWDQAVSDAAKLYELPYSGRTMFVETVMYLKINHTVAPADQALECSDCHSKVGKTRMEWKKLGYPQGDPRYHRGARFRKND